MPYIITPEDETLIELIVQACRKLDGGGWSEVCRRMMSDDKPVLTGGKSYKDPSFYGPFPSWMN